MGKKQSWQSTRHLQPLKGVKQLRPVAKSDVCLFHSNSPSDHPHNFLIIYRRCTSRTHSVTVWHKPPLIERHQWQVNECKRVVRVAVLCMYVCAGHFNRKRRQWTSRCTPTGIDVIQTKTNEQTTISSRVLVHVCLLFCNWISQVSQTGTLVKISVLQCQYAISQGGIRLTVPLTIQPSP